MSDGTATWSYIYDANGMRTQRSNGTTAYNYVYNGSQLSQMTVGNNTLNFAYDASGTPMTVTYNGTNYYYIVNLQGDVMGIVDSTGTIVVNYTYDAWGKPLTTSGSLADTLGVQNPLRYRGYVYDQETGLYYLQSRYYDPEIGRFINADALVATGQGLLGNNMFTYCLNNPVVLSDATGTLSRVCVSDVFNPLRMPGADGTRGPGGGGFAKRNYSTPSNKKSGLINGQETFEFANWACGAGTYGDNGCAIIAVYNAMQLLGKPQSLGAVEREFEWEHGMLLFGLWGVGPWEFDDYFAAHGVSCTGYDSFNAMKRNISNGDIVVFTVMNNAGNIFSGFHTMAAQYTNGRFIVYNAYSRRSSPYPFISLDSVYDNSAWLYGYIVGR